MKKFLSLLAASLLAALPVIAAPQADPDPADVKMETKSYSYSGFSELQVSWTYQVALTQADHYSVRVEAPDFVFPYLDVRVTGNRLVLGTKDIPRDIVKKLDIALRRNEIRAWVAMPELSALQMSGASHLDATGQFSAKRFDFKMELSGATVLRGLSIAAGDADLRTSGAAKFDIHGDFSDLTLNLSGATTGSLDVGKNVDEAEMNLSGATKLNLTGYFNQLDIEASGAVNIKMAGSVRELDLMAAGAAKADLGDIPADQVEVSLSGAAKAELYVLKTLEATLSGASTCNYKAGPDFRLTKQSVSRGASLKRL